MRYKVICVANCWDIFPASSDADAAHQLASNWDSGKYGPRGDRRGDPHWNLITLVRVDQEEILTPVPKIVL